MLFGNRRVPLVQVSFETARETCHNVATFKSTNSYSPTNRSTISYCAFEKIESRTISSSQVDKTRVFMESGTVESQDGKAGKAGDKAARNTP